MPTFHYLAEDARGNVVSGLIEATDEQSVSAALRDQQLHPTRIRAQEMILEPLQRPVPETAIVPLNHGISNGTAIATAPATVDSVDFLNTAPPVTQETSFSEAVPITPSRDNPFFTPVGQQTRIDAAPFLVGVPLTDMAVFYRQMGTLLAAGVPLVQSLVALSEQAKNTRLKQVLVEMTTIVSQGHPLSRVMDKYPAVFSPLQIEMIRAAEISGLMERMCHRLADYLEREIEIKRKINKETLYPKIVLFVAGCVMLLLNFLKAGAEGPLALLRFWGGVALLGFLGFWALRFFNQYPQVGATLDRIKLMIPGVGGVARRYATARFCRALAALYSGGISLPLAVAISGRACGNRAIGQAMIDNIYRLNQGDGITGMLAASGLLSPVAIQMARTGEQTGGLDAMMDKVADYEEGEADVKSHQFAMILGVVMLIIAAIQVFLIALEFYSGGISNAMQAGEQ